MLALSGAVLAMSACGGDYEDQRDKVLGELKGEQVGASPDYLLTKYGMGGRDPVALVFGMADDYAYCQELAEMYMKRYPADTYSCEPAN